MTWIVRVIAEPLENWLGQPVESPMQCVARFPVVYVGTATMNDIGSIIIPVNNPMPLGAPPRWNCALLTKLLQTLVPFVVAGL